LGLAEQLRGQALRGLKQLQVSGLARLDGGLNVFGLTRLGDTTADRIRSSAPGWFLNDDGTSSFSQLVNFQSVLNVASLVIPLPATGFKHARVKLKIQGLTAAANTGNNLRMNADAGFNYNYQSMSANNAAQTDLGVAAASAISLGNMPAGTAPAGEWAVVVIDLFDYTSATDHKQVTVKAYQRSAAGAGGMVIYEVGASWDPAVDAAVTSLTILASAGNINAIASTYGEP
jgi:hypothetical protein